MDLAHRGADARRGLDLPQLGVDENRNHDARVLEPLHGAGHGFLVVHDVEAAFRRDLGAAFRHEHRHLGLDATCDADHLVGGRHFEIQPDVRELSQAAHVLVLDVAPVFAQVAGDAVGAAKVSFHRRPHRVRLIGAPRLPHGRDVVDVDAKLDHSSFNSISTLRVCSTCPCRRWPISARIR